MLRLMRIWGFLFWFVTRRVRLTIDITFSFVILLWLTTATLQLCVWVVHLWEPVKLETLTRITVCLLTLDLIRWVIGDLPDTLLCILRRVLRAITLAVDTVCVMVHATEPLLLSVISKWLCYRVRILSACTLLVLLLGLVMLLRLIVCRL